MTARASLQLDIPPLPHTTPSIGSNNPYRSSMLTTTSHNPPLNRTTSTATTIALRPSFDTTTPTTNLSATPTIVTSKPSPDFSTTSTRHTTRPSLTLPGGTPRKSISDIIVTMEAAPSPKGGDVESGDYCKEIGRKSLQMDAAWPARKMEEKMEMKRRRVRIAVKVVIAIVIIAGAVALGLGITKAVRDAKEKEKVG
ncbi:hypothetical protein EX30DRAFT_350615 [Ascodesmis nigricans]|uniref:Uncharacterized protein n=1 Tax=Ascodesmis nigricans TaxID=341454 RepID=A0A4S2MSH4_9PEZI|nr:hypothetical protein EX30DRAFT_350615 [Ascodesmis nigricans]